MRTKLLLGLAAIAVSVATCVAQQSNVYSLNIVGYVNVDVAKGMNLISNPLKPSDNNYSIANTIVLPDNLDGALIYKWGGTGWNPATPGWVAGAGGGWDTPLTINLGEAFFLNAPNASKITFVGEVQTGPVDYSVAKGISFVAPKIPVAMNFPGKNDANQIVGNDGDAIYVWGTGGWSTTSWSFVQGIGWDASNPADANLEGPMVPIGKGIVYQNTGAGPLNWTRTFNP